jgi:hypothetical protein
MAVTLYEITIPVFIGHLKTLSKILEKGVAFTKEGGAKISEAELAETKLIDDMGGLIYQGEFLLSFVFSLDMKIILRLFSGCQKYKA